MFAISIFHFNGAILFSVLENHENDTHGEKFIIIFAAAILNFHLPLAPTKIMKMKTIIKSLAIRNFVPIQKRGSYFFQTSFV